MNTIATVSPPPDSQSQNTQDLEFINTLTNMCITEGSLDDIQTYVSKETRKIFSSNGATVYMVTDDQIHLRIMNSNLQPEMMYMLETLTHMKIPLVEVTLSPDSIYKSILEDRKPVIINDPDKIMHMALESTANPQYQALIPQAMSLLHVTSVVLVPLINNEKPVGLLEISRNSPFSAQELERFTLIASRIQSVIIKKKSDDLLKKQKEELEKLNKTMIERELRMSELKADNKQLRKRITELSTKG